MSLRKNTILSALRSATVNDFEGFEVYYQPILDSADRIIGAEALLRFFMHSDDGDEMISPVEFIPLLEKSRLIIPVGEFVLNEAAKMCREMQQYIADFRVNINVSYIQIMRGSMANKILTAIRANNLRPESICIEMTESGFMDMTPCFCSFRKKLDENNIQFIIDDFGTGYSNLRYISEMNPDYVKIDKDFTAMAMRSEKDHELFRKIIEMVHSVNIKICIEGIEKEEWAGAMKEIHVDYMQGYLYGRPCEKGRVFKQLWDIRNIFRELQTKRMPMKYLKEYLNVQKKLNIKVLGNRRQITCKIPKKKLFPKGLQRELSNTYWRKICSRVTSFRTKP